MFGFASTNNSVVPLRNRCKLGLNEDDALSTQFSLFNVSFAHCYVWYRFVECLSSSIPVQPNRIDRIARMFASAQTRQTFFLLVFLLFIFHIARSACPCYVCACVWVFVWTARVFVFDSHDFMNEWKELEIFRVRIWGAFMCRRVFVLRTLRADSTLIFRSRKSLRNGDMRSLLFLSVSLLSHKSLSGGNSKAHKECC